MAVLPYSFHKQLVRIQSGRYKQIEQYMMEKLYYIIRTIGKSASRRGFMIQSKIWLSNFEYNKGELVFDFMLMTYGFVHFASCLDTKNGF